MTKNNAREKDAASARFNDDASLALAAALSGPGGPQRVPAVKAALAAGADPQFDQAWALAKWGMGGEKPLPLHMAMRWNDAELARLLLSAGADPHVPSLDGSPASSWAHGSEVALAWIEGGGDPWRIESGPSGKVGCMAHHQTRGGSEELWAAIGAALPPGGDPNPPCDFGFPHNEKSLAEHAVQWSNVAALKTIASLGAKFSPDCLGEVGACMACHPRRDGARHRRMGQLLLELGAPMPSPDRWMRIARITGEAQADQAREWLESTRLEIERKALAKAARKRGSQKKTGPRL